jgi:uncharacterized membrane protein YebE (DUF533 family)
MFETTIREALADGIVTDDERENLERLKKQFGMSDEKVESIERQVREEKAQQAKMQSSQLA